MLAPGSRRFKGRHSAYESAMGPQKAHSAGLAWSRTTGNSYPVPTAGSRDCGETSKEPRERQPLGHRGGRAEVERLGFREAAVGFG